MCQPEIIFRGDNIVSVLSLVWDWVFQLRVPQSHCLCLIYLCYMVVFRQIDQRPVWVRAVQNTCRTGWHKKSTWSGLCGECLLWLFVHVIHLMAFFFLCYWCLDIHIIGILSYLFAMIGLVCLLIFLTDLTGKVVRRY